VPNRTAGRSANTDTLAVSSATIRASIVTLLSSLHAGQGGWASRKAFRPGLLRVGDQRAERSSTRIAIITPKSATCLPAGRRRRHGATLSPLVEHDEIFPLKVLIANERRDRLELLAQVILGLGHDVIAREIDVREVGAVTAREHPDVALVGLGNSSQHALDLIAEIVHTATCPVIALLPANDSAYVHEAAKRGVFAYLVDADAEELQSAIEITLQRFAEYQNLQGAFGRRALIEQAKGVLMERHGCDQSTAFEMLRSHSQRTGRKVVDVADAVVESHLLLPRPAPEQAVSAPDEG
jgi:AmiR/NasT family two-component response regulator